jgi:hypothetical protein
MEHVGPSHITAMDSAAPALRKGEFDLRRELNAKAG